MSTSRSRLTRSIQEIAKRDPDLRRAIEATKPRGDQPSAAGVGASDAERDRVCCDGTVSGDANPGTSERDTSEGGQDGLNPDDTADISDMGPGSLAGLTDCATGEPVCFEGGDWVPPDGWEEPNTPPPAIPDGALYEDGYYWVTAEGHSNIFASSSCESRLAEKYDPVEQPWWNVRIRTVEDLVYCEFYSIFGTNRERLYNRSCITEFDLACNEEPYQVDSWPSDDCVNLAIKNGSIVGSKYDPENDGTYSKPMSEIELCDDFGNSFYLRPSAGGWKTINATKDAGYLWGSNGQKIAHINGNEYSDPSI